jgi:hypothetical protein
VILTIEVADIYFLIGLSQCENPIVLKGGKGSDSSSIVDYISTHYHPQSYKSSNQLQIKDVQQFPLCTILFMIIQVVISTTIDLAYRDHVQYSLECLNPTMYEWFIGLLVNLRY